MVNPVPYQEGGIAAEHTGSELVTEKHCSCPGVYRKGEEKGKREVA